LNDAGCSPALGVVDHHHHITATEHAQRKKALEQRRQSRQTEQLDQNPQSQTKTVPRGSQQVRGTTT